MSVSPRDLTAARRLRARKSVLGDRVKKTNALASSTKQGLPSTRTATEIKTFPERSRPLPPLLKLLLWIQRGSCVVTFALIGTALASYAATVYLQQQWSDAYKTLEGLQREIRNLTAADETFKHQLGKQAQNPKEGLTFPSPKQTLYLSPSAINSVQAPVRRNELFKNASPSNIPLGY